MASDAGQPAPELLGIRRDGRGCQCIRQYRLGNVLHFLERDSTPQQCSEAAANVTSAERLPMLETSGTSGGGEGHRHEGSIVGAMPV
ncbi:MAG: hypothetical protein BGO98_36090 [Myxococcales bacterium 68-20]|nr:MAG: hypothetical protein BGO98_36090 [Myxococcales bacterium 68-20]